MGAMGISWDHSGKLYQIIDDSREQAGGTSTVKGILGQLATDIPPVAALFVLRYGKICDNAHLIIGIVGKTARSRS
jgi:hypothetical protein